MNPIKQTKLLSKKEFERQLKDRFNLVVDYKMITMYVDNYNCNKHAYSVEGPKVFTIDYNDIQGFGWANTNGWFYKHEVVQDTELLKEFKKFKNEHTFKHKDHFLI